MEWIDAIIQSGKFNSIQPERGEYYSRCNLFTDEVAKIGWGVDLPRLASDRFVKEQYPENFRGNEDHPMSAVSLNNYYKARSKLKGSGVYRVPADLASKFASKGKLVLVLGHGHSTIAAPSDKSWPLIYRSDLSYRGNDARTRVGLKDKDSFNYFLIEPEEYNNFTGVLKQLNIDDMDVYEKYITDKNRTIDNPKYNQVHTLFEKQKTAQPKKGLLSLKHKK